MPLVELAQDLIHPLDSEYIVELMANHLGAIEVTWAFVGRAEPSLDHAQLFLQLRLAALLQE